MSMFKLYKLSLWLPTKGIGRTSLNNKESIVLGALGVKIQVRAKSYYKYNYSETLEILINKQVQVEQQAAQDYLGMAVSFLHPKLSRPGAGGFFMKMYEEEMGHMQDFLQYQILRGGVPKVSGIKEAEVDLSLTLYDAFTRALAMERKVTEDGSTKYQPEDMNPFIRRALKVKNTGQEVKRRQLSWAIIDLLECIVKAAEDSKDYQCADFVTSVFLGEQMKSINEMSQHVTKLSRICEEHALYHYDLEIARTHPFEFKIKL